jgi:hypothetical protein
MALVTLGRPGEAGEAVIRGTLCLPRIGAWHADLHVDTTTLFSGRVELRIGANPAMVGTVTRAEVWGAVLRCRVVAGAGALAKDATPRHYARPTFGIVLDDVCSSVGEASSTLVADGLRARRLSRWTTLRMPAGQALRSLVEAGAPAGYAWRHLSDGRIWVGAETWPDAGVEARELHRTPEDARLEFGLDDPILWPGTTVDGLRIDYVEATIDPDKVRVQAWWTT